MIKDIYDKICDGEEVRKSLIALKEELKDSDAKRAFAYLLAGDFSVLTKLLEDADAKVRKNAAAILGRLESEDVLDKLVKAYREEKQLFVKPAYLKAIYDLDFHSYLPQFKERLRELVSSIPNAEEMNIKHIRQEITELQKLIFKYEKPKAHRFHEDSCYPDVILLCNSRFREVTAKQIKTGEITMLAGGIKIEHASLAEIMQIRTWRELLFPIHAKKCTKADPDEMAKMVVESNLLDLVDTLHDGTPPFYFRLDIKSSMDEGEKRELIRKTAVSIQEKSSRKLLNSTSDYEIEIRLVQSKKGGFIPLLKCHRLRDKRFLYRKELVASSIRPVNAALIMRLADSYLKEDAQVLDPCCGVGTMLIERTYFRHADPMYGVDIFGEAIAKARINSEAAGMPIHFINRDYFAFTHEYLFDEIITELEATEDESFYKRFFAKSANHLKEGGIAVLYSRKGAALARVAKGLEEWEVLEDILIDEKQNSRLVIVRLGNTK